MSTLEWDAYVAAHPGASSYHQAAWRNVFANAFGHSSVYLAAQSGGRVVGLLPLVVFRSRLFGTFAVSLPFVNYGGVIADERDAALALAGRAVSLSRENGWSHVELRHVAQQFPVWPVKRHKVAMSLQLPDTAALLWDGLDRKVRNLVRKAEKSGCAVETGHEDLLDEFYGVFARNMRDLGTPVYGRAFFSEVLRAFPAHTRVFVVRVGSEPVAASLVVGWRDRLEVPWASSLRTHASRAPNMLLYRSMLEWAIDQGYATFDFGRSTPDEGTFHFKKQWGAEPTPLSWEYLGLEGPPPDQGPANPKFRMAIAAWQRLPVRVATWVGPHVVRNIP